MIQRRTILGPVCDGAPKITVGLVAESYQIYANGVKIGDPGDSGAVDVRFFAPRSFDVPAEAIRPGKPLVIALRIRNPHTSWGSLTDGLQDRGPYRITTAEHASAAVDAARQGVRLALTPAFVVIAGECGIGLCLMLLWFTERDRWELL